MCGQVLPIWFGGKVSFVEDLWLTRVISELFIIIRVNVVHSWSLSIVEWIWALVLLSSGHLVQAMVRIRGLDGERFERRLKRRVQGGTGPSRTAWRHFGETGGQHFCPPCLFSVCFGKSDFHFPALPTQSLWIWVCELHMNLAQVPTVFSSSQ